MAITISLDSSEKLDSSNSLCSDDDQGSGVHVSMPVEDSRGYYIDSDASVGSNRTRKQGSKYDSTTYRDGPRRSRSIYPRGPTSIGSNARGTRKEAASKPGRNLDIQVKEKACDAILRPDDQAKDITLHLEMNGAVDLSDELAHLSRLNILGHFKAGISFFESRLASHVDFFPVVAEYIDLLLEQGDSGKLAEFAHERLHDPLTTYSCHERSILKLTKGVANMRAKGSLLPALELAKKFLKLREDLGAGSDQYSEGEFSAQTQSKNTTSNHKGASSRLNLPIGLQVLSHTITIRIFGLVSRELTVVSTLLSDPRH